MKIDEVITQTVIAIYQNPQLAETLLLKGGIAIRLLDEITTRLSIDADFSLAGRIENDASFFKLIESCVRKKFKEYNFNVIDFKHQMRPKEKSPAVPNWWRGWSCEFKLVSKEHTGKTLESQRRNALVPEGSNSSKITIDISEHEYCGETRSRKICGVRILGYSRELIVLEKLRAICQQHPDYKYRSSKNRARDFYDIYELTVKMDDQFANRCSRHIKNVFEAKEVPMDFLKFLWNEDFMDGFRRGFDEVKDTVSGKVQNFDVYVEHLRFLILDIWPKAIEK